MARLELVGGGWFDPDTSSVIQWQNKSQGRTVDMTLFLTSRGAVVQRVLQFDKEKARIADEAAKAGRTVPDRVYKSLSWWAYQEISRVDACDLMIKSGGSREAARWFPNEFKWLMCDLLVRRGKLDDAKRLFPNEFPQVWEKHRAEER
jgi:hypothetical protein